MASDCEVRTLSSIGSEIKSWCKQNKVNQTELAAALDVSTMTVRRVWKGTKELTSVQIAIMLEVMPHVTADFFIPTDMGERCIEYAQNLNHHFAGWCSKRSWNVCVSALHKHGNLFNCNNNDYNYNDHQHDYEPTLYSALFKVKMVHFLSDAIDQYYWLGYYDSFIRFCGEGNCTFDLGWIDRNSLHFIDFGLWNLLYLCIL